MAIPEILCQSCTKLSQKTCSGCKCSRYCSVKCQKADSPTHKILCGAYSTFDLTSRPSKDHFLGVVFAPDKEKPHLTWLHCPFDKGLLARVFDYKPHLGHDFNTCASVNFSTAQDRDLPDTVQIFYRDKFFIDGYSLPNRAVGAVTQMPGIAHFDWRGPLAAFVTVGDNEAQCRDMTLADFRHAVDFLRSKSGVGLNSCQAFQHTGVKAVRINCDGAQATSGVPLYEAITIPSGHSLFDRHGVPTIPERIGQTLLTTRDPHDPAWTGTSLAKNAAATSLHLSCNDDKTWGQSPVGWPRDDEVGSVLVVRPDRQPLDPLHVEAIVRFCQVEMALRFEASQLRRAVLAAITRDAFEAFWVKFLQKKRLAGNETD